MYARSKTTKKQIEGTLETVTARANLLKDAFTRNGDGSLSYDHEGESEIFWDGMHTVENEGQTVFLDVDGEEVLEGDVELFEPCEECEGDGSLQAGTSGAVTIECPACHGTGDAEGTCSS